MFCYTPRSSTLDGLYEFVCTSNHLGITNTRYDLHEQMKMSVRNPWEYDFRHNCTNRILQCTLQREPRKPSHFEPQAASRLLPRRALPQICDNKCDQDVLWFSFQLWCLAPTSGCNPYVSNVFDTTFWFCINQRLHIRFTLHDICDESEQCFVNAEVALGPNISSEDVVKLPE